MKMRNVCMESIIYACVLVPLSSRYLFFAASKTEYKAGGTILWENGPLG